MHWIDELNQAPLAEQIWLGVLLSVALLLSVAWVLGVLHWFKHKLRQRSWLRKAGGVKHKGRIFIPGSVPEEDKPVAWSPVSSDAPWEDLQKAKAIAITTPYGSKPAPNPVVTREEFDVLTRRVDAAHRKIYGLTHRENKQGRVK